jgi:hypothetical protein
MLSLLMCNPSLSFPLRQEPSHELAKAFSERWRIPRRAVARQMLQRAIREGDLRGNIDIETAIDMLYAPLYYRLQIDSGPISDAWVDSLFEHAIAGLI